MQHVVIIGVGRLREKFFRDAADEYKKRLSRYVKLEVVEVDDLVHYVFDVLRIGITNINIIILIDTKFDLDFTRFHSVFQTEKSSIYHQLLHFCWIHTSLQIMNSKSIISEADCVGSTKESLRIKQNNLS